MIARVSWAASKFLGNHFQNSSLFSPPTDPKYVSNTWGNPWLAKNNNKKKHYHDNNHNNDDNDNDIW